MRIHIREQQQGAGGKPAQPNVGNAALQTLREPRNQPEFIQIGGHHNQRTEPNDGVPRAFLFQHVVPCQYACQQQQHQAQ